MTEEYAHQIVLPNQEQVDEFIRHLWNVHSWYKHSPLLEGLAFAVFLSSDSGSNYPLEHPELKYGNHLDGYRKQFGFLDYAYSNDNTHFLRDGAEILYRSDIDDIEIKEEFVLYPYVHSEIYWGVHEKALEQISRHDSHPHHTQLTKFHKLSEECDSFADEMSDEELDYCLDAVIDDAEYPPDYAISPMAHGYIKNKQQQTAIWLSLQAKERDKIKTAIESLVRNFGQAYLHLP